MVIRELAKVEFTYTNGEHRVFALVETETDFVIAPGYDAMHRRWNGSGDYMPKAFNPTVDVVLRNYYGRIQDELNSSWTESARFV